MAYDEDLAQRVRSLVARLAAAPVAERLMFGGLAFLLAGNMAVAVQGSRAGLLVRVDPADIEQLIAEPGADVMQMRGRPMGGWITVSAEVLTKDADLRRWVRRGIAYASTLPPK